MKDTKVFILNCALTIVSMSIYFFVCGGITDGPLSLIMYFLGTLGCGSNINIMYLMIELRVPPEKLGSSIVVIFTGAVFFNTFSSNIAYSD